MKKFEIDNKKVKNYKLIVFLAFSLLFVSKIYSQEDHSFFSKAFQTKRFYRIYLPRDYNSSNKRYPVIYYFHGWGGRYKWDSHNLTDDPFYPENGRKEPPFVMEWRNYTKTHDVIIVTWDGYEPKYQPGRYIREGIKYGGCNPYDYLRAHNLKRKIRGWDYRLYFRDLVAHIDSNYRTIPNRNNRAITGLSMGGLMAYYIAGQNKDLINSVSAFCPADNYPLFGVKGKQVVFPILEMYRSLKGLYVRFTMTDGDWLKYNDRDLIQLWSVADLTHFEFHEAHYYDHAVADSKEQLDFHMKHFGEEKEIPQSWNYVLPGFQTFEIFGYYGKIVRDKPALTLINKYTNNKIKIFARTFIPDGPIVQNEKIDLQTNLPYSTNTTVTAYNLSTGEFSNPKPVEKNNKLGFTLKGGGHVLGINGKKTGNTPKIFLLDKKNRDYFYFETGKEYVPAFDIVNVGNKDADNVTITAISGHPYFSFKQNTIGLKKIKAGGKITNVKKIKFSISKFDKKKTVGNLLFEIKINEVVADTQKVIFFTTPQSPYVSNKDVIILDGRTVKNIPVFHQEKNAVIRDILFGGKGNGNGIAEKGEEILVFVKIPKGMSPVDTNTFHKTYLINQFDDPYITVNKLKYDEKIHQAAATSVSSIITISKEMPKKHILDLWLRIESLYNDSNDSLAKNAVYAHKYDYRRVKIGGK